MILQITVGTIGYFILRLFFWLNPDVHCTKPGLSCRTSGLSPNHRFTKCNWSCHICKLYNIYPWLEILKIPEILQNEPKFKKYILLTFLDTLSNWDYTSRWDWLYITTNNLSPHCLTFISISCQPKKQLFLSVQPRMFASQSPVVDSQDLTRNSQYYNLTCICSNWSTTAKLNCMLVELVVIAFNNFISINNWWKRKTILIFGKIQTRFSNKNM